MSQNQQSPNENNEDSDKSENDYLKDWNSTYGDDQRKMTKQRLQETQEKIIKKLQNISSKDIANKFKDNQMKISNLSITKYQKLVNDKSSNTLHSMPDLTIANMLNHRKDMSFLSFQEIKLINNNLLQLLQQSFRSTKGQWHQYYQHLFLNPSEQLQQVNKSVKSLSMVQNQNDVSLDQVMQQKNYNKKQLVDFELIHNKEQIKQLQKMNIEEEQIELHQFKQKQQIEQNKFKDYPKIKKYPGALTKRKKKQSALIQSMNDVQSISQEDVNNQQQSQNQLKPQQSQTDLSTRKSQSSQSIEKIQNKKIEQQQQQQVTQQKANKLSSRQIGPGSSAGQENVKYNAFWYNFENNSWKPDAVECGGLTTIGDKAYLYGGLGLRPMNEIFQLDIKKHQWIKIKTTGEVPKLGRFNHSVNSFKKIIVIFGGESKIDPELKESECLTDLRLLNLETNEWRTIRPTGDIIQARRGHAATVLGKFLLVHGGIDQRSRYLSDIWHFELTSCRWSLAQVEGEMGFISEGVAYHNCCSVFNSEKKGLTLYKPSYYEDSNQRYGKKLKHEGIYFFGGVNQAQEPQNQLLILKTETRPMYWIEPETLGRRPTARYNYTLIYHQIIDILVIYGGRNEMASESQGFLNDLFILDLESMVWREAQLFGIPKPPRAGHCAFFHDSKLYLFGGFNSNGFIQSGVDMIELDEDQAVLQQKLKIDEDNRKHQQELRKQRQEEKQKLKENTSRLQYIMECDDKAVVENEQDNEETKLKKEQLKILEKQQQELQKQIQRLSYSDSQMLIPLPINTMNKMQKILNSYQVQNKYQAPSTIQEHPDSKQETSSATHSGQKSEQQKQKNSQDNNINQSENKDMEQDNKQIPQDQQKEDQQSQQQFQQPITKEDNKQIINLQSPNAQSITIPTLRSSVSNDERKQSTRLTETQQQNEEKQKTGSEEEKQLNQKSQKNQILNSQYKQLQLLVNEDKKGEELLRNSVQLPRISNAASESKPKRQSDSNISSSSHNNSNKDSQFKLPLILTKGIIQNDQQ